MTRLQEPADAVSTAAPTTAARVARVAVRVYAIVRSTLLTVGAIIGAACVIAALAAVLLGIRPLVVISGSMEPDIPVGAMVFSRTVPVDEVSVGDVVTVERPRELGLVTHRVEAIQEVDGATELTLRGDANASADPEPYRVDEAGLYVLDVPVLGTIAMALRSTSGLVMAGGLLLSLLALALLDPARLASDPEERTPSGDDDEASGARSVP